MTREEAWAETTRLVRARWALKPGQRWESRHWRDGVDHFDRLSGNPTAPLGLQTKWRECEECAGSRVVGALPFVEARRWLEYTGRQCPECAGKGWLELDRPEPVSPRLAWEIAWLGGIRRFETPRQRGRGSFTAQAIAEIGGGWSSANWESTVWEFARIIADPGARRPLIRWQLWDACQRLGIGLNHVRTMGKPGWEVLGKQAGLKGAPRGHDRQALLALLPVEWPEVTAPPKCPQQWQLSD